MIYLDNNASTPLDPHVTSVLFDAYANLHGNPSSAHHDYGRRAAGALAAARHDVQAALDASDHEVIFTAGATEALNLAIQGLEPRRVLVSAVEHKAVLEVCRWLERARHVEVERVPVCPSGALDLDALRELLREPTSLVAVQMVNGETGVVQPMDRIVELAHSRGVPVLADAAQAVGRIPVDLSELPIDLVAVSSHKIYGPPGVGALYLRRRSVGGRLRPIMFGGGQELGLRPGTENVPEIVGFAAAMRLSVDRLNTDTVAVGALRDGFERELESALPTVSFNGRASRRVANTSNFSLHEVDVVELLRHAPDVAVSTGSACESKNPAPSHVLRAMGVPVELASNAIRVSFGRFSTSGDAEVAVKSLAEAWRSLR